jgi:putative N-acetylmannosamine-6-phosphate epimerase/predicted NBD/HSP70 family sugar kinase
MKAENVLVHLRRCPLVASVQATEKSAVDHPETLLRLARASVAEGVTVLRLEGLKNVRAIKPIVQKPVIGLLKRRYPGSDVYITPTLEDADTMIDEGCEIIAIDATDRIRPRNTDLARMIPHIKRRKALVMADCDTLASAIRAVELGADFVGTTLAGYTPARAMTSGPDFDLLRAILAGVSVPVFAEGRYTERWQVETALRMGAAAVVVGGALNDPVKQTRALKPDLPPKGDVGAVDIGGTWLRFAEFSADGTMKGESVRTPNPPTREERIAWIRERIAEAGVVRVGVSTGGIVDPHSGEVWTAKEYLMKDHTGIVFNETTLGVPTFAFGDGHATAWGHACRPEFAGLRVASLALGTGVGCGFVQKGKIWCGRRGEYPRINDLPASGGKSYEELLGGIHISAQPTEEAKEDAVAALRGAMTALRDLYFPDEIIVGGAVGLSDWLAPHVHELGGKLSPFGREAGIYGAAALALYPSYRD